MTVDESDAGVMKTLNRLQGIGEGVESVNVITTRTMIDVNGDDTRIVGGPGLGLGLLHPNVGERKMSQRTTRSDVPRSAKGHDLETIQMTVDIALTEGETTSGTVPNEHARAHLHLNLHVPLHRNNHAPLRPSHPLPRPNPQPSHPQSTIQNRTLLTTTILTSKKHPNSPQRWTNTLKNHTTLVST